MASTQFADEMLLERLRICGTSDLSDPLVRAKWSVNDITLCKNSAALRWIVSLESSINVFKI